MCTTGETTNTFKNIAFSSLTSTHLFWQSNECDLPSRLERQFCHLKTKQQCIVCEWKNKSSEQFQQQNKQFIVNCKNIVCHAWICHSNFNLMQNTWHATSMSLSIPKWSTWQSMREWSLTARCTCPLTQKNMTCRFVCVWFFEAKFGLGTQCSVINHFLLLMSVTKVKLWLTS